MKIICNYRANDGSSMAKITAPSCGTRRRKIWPLFTSGKELDSNDGFDQNTGLYTHIPADLGHADQSTLTVP